MSPSLASLLLQLLGWVFLPVYIASGVCTLPEYMKKRFGGERIHIYLALLSLILYIFTKISVNLYSGSLFLTEALKWNTWVSIVLLLLLTGLITVTGGLAAVLYTDTLQFFVMIIGAIILSVISYLRVGGFPGILSSYGQAIAQINISSIESSNLIISLANALNATKKTISLTELADLPEVPSNLKCSLPSSKAFTLLREIDDPDMPWLGFLLGQTPASIWYWCTDQMMVQRVLAAKSLSHAQGATLMAGLIKQLPLFIMVIPGMISRILFPDEIGCTPGPNCYRICGQKSGCSNLAYPKLVINIMPSGLRGLMLAVMLAALISDLTSIFNSASTLFTVDIYQKIRKNVKNMELMIVSRIFVIVLILLSIAWIPVIQELQGSQLFLYIQAISAYLAPPVASVYLCAVLIKRSTERGAFVGLIYGLIIGLIRLILTIIYHEPICGELDTRPWIIKHIHYMYFALFSFITCGIIVCLISFTEKPPTNEQLYRLTYWTAWDNSNSITQIITTSTTLYTVKSQNGIHFNDNNIMNKYDHRNDDNVDGGSGGGGDSIDSIHHISNKPYYKDEMITRAKVSNHKLCHSDIDEEKNTPLDFQLDNGNIENKQPVNKTITEVRDDCKEVESFTLHTSSLSSSSSYAYRLMKNICLWFCGCTDHPCSDVELRNKFGCKCCFSDIKKKNSSSTFKEKTNDDDDDHIEKRIHIDQEKYLAKITSLKQDPQIKLGLYIGLILIIILSIFGFIFFSVYFGPISIGPLPIIGNSTNFNETLIKQLQLLEKNKLIIIH
ncbi:unnamed protein product [Heterobilharzia americana]|nr:unnamed protein product [Heterobilharzia americana]